jgi:Cytotoxic
LRRKPIPRPSLLDTCDYLGYIYRERRWRDRLQNMLYTWDSLHGEIEAFSLRGEHRGALDPLTGQQIKPAVKGRRIRV